MTADKLVPGLEILPTTVPDAEALTVTPATPAPRGAAGRITLTAAQLRVNQRIAQAAMRRANALERRLMTGLDQDDFTPCTITAIKIHPSLRRPRS